MLVSVIVSVSDKKPSLLIPCTDDTLPLWYLVLRLEVDRANFYRLIIPSTTHSTAPAPRLDLFIAYALHRTRLHESVAFAALNLLQRLKVAPSSVLVMHNTMDLSRVCYAL